MDGGVAAHVDRVDHAGRRGGTYPFTISDTQLRFGAPIAGAARLVLRDFEATFDCCSGPHGTTVTQREMFRFRAPWRWITNPLLRRWLPADVEAEMQRFQTLIDVDRAGQDRPVSRRWAADRAQLEAVVLTVARASSAAASCSSR